MRPTRSAALVAAIPLLVSSSAFAWALEAAAGLALALHRLGREAESRVLSDRALAGVLPHADAGTRRSAGFAAGLLYSLARDRGDEETEQRLLAGWPSLSTSP